MKPITLLFLTLLLLVYACNNNQNPQESSKDTQPNNQPVLLHAYDLQATMDKIDELPVVLTGTIVEVCQMSGCWLEIDLGDNQRLLVTFPEEVFVTPKESVGKTVEVTGVVEKVIIPIKRLQLQAADEGATEAEVNAIAEPHTEYSIAATRVQMK